MKIALAQFNPIIGDFQYNCRKIRELCDQAKGRQCDLIVLPELAVAGYPPRDLLEKSDFVDANLRNLEKLVASIHGIGVICGFIDKNLTDEGNQLFNAALHFEDGRILHRTYKRLLPTYDVFDEMRYFEPGKDMTIYPYKGFDIGLTICEDVWNDKDIFKRRIYHQDPVAMLVQNGANLIVNVSASPFYKGKREFKWEMFSKMTLKYKVPIVYVNQVGGNDSLLFDGISIAFDPQGNIVARALDFEEDLVVFDTASFQGDIHPVAESDTESIVKALVMGTRDYVRKCGFKKVVIGLSGGIDSALTACIAVSALGKENVLCVFMPSRYTSRDNYEDTRQLADHLGVEFITIPIDGIFNEFLKYLSPSFQEDAPEITEQNIQARIRGTILMALSNKRNCILLTTGNKSELAVGYCTLYGDMNGGLAVISDVPKTMVYELSRFINLEKEIIPERTIHKAPSAELKPDQEDQDELPPYEILDQILKAYIEELKGYDEIVHMGFDKQLVKEVIAKIDQNEYKRHQAAPGLKVTSRAFGYGRRYPLAKRFRPEG